MNPINDEIPAEDSSEVKGSSEPLRESDLDKDLQDNEKTLGGENFKKTTTDVPSNEQNEDQAKHSENDHVQKENTKNDELLETEERNQLEESEMDTATINEKQNAMSDSKNEIVYEENSSKSDGNKEDKIKENMKIIESSVTESSKTLETDSEAHTLKQNAPASDICEKHNIKDKQNMNKTAENLVIESAKTLEIAGSEEHDFNENSSESDVNEKYNNKERQHKLKNIAESSILKSKKTLETQDFEKLNKESSDVSEPATEDETEEFEDVEDVEIPGEQEVDEIIVPDEAEAEDLTDGRDQNEEMDKSQTSEAEDEEEEEQQSLKESDIEDNDSEINLHEGDEETTKSSEAPEKDEEDNGESGKKSVNINRKEDTSSKSSEEAEELVVLADVTKAKSCREQPKSDQPSMDEDTTTQGSYDPLNCADNKEADDDDDGENASVKNVESENSNGSRTLEKNEKDVTSTKNIESENENSVESQSQQKNENEEDDEDDEVQFVEIRNSPICIESDDDDDGANTTEVTVETPASSTSNNSDKIDSNRRTITTATTTVTVPRNIVVTRTSARKSTAKPPQTQLRTSNSPAIIVPQIQNKTKSSNYLQKSSTLNKRTFTGTSAQQIVDCIELLDSSDEESSSRISHTQKYTQQQRTPQKRTLLAAKGNFYKNSNTSKQASLAVDRLPHNFTPQIRQQPKKPAPPPLPPPTPQSNFLNAVQLQPAAVAGANPPAFSALLSNKNVIIPNAFYGNPPNIRGASNESEVEKRSVRWLENFVNQFCKPQFEPTHSCYVFLQRALRYKDFIRIKALRTSMNNHVQNASNELNIDLMSDLKTIFFKNVKKITNYGQRFCELTCTAAAGKSVTLITHRLSGKVTLKTCNIEFPKPVNTTSASNPTTSSHAGAKISSTRKRQLDEDEDEYTPDKSLYKTKGKPPSENGDEDSGDTGDGRKRSLRTKRTKRIDNSFSYNEDDLLAEYEIDDAEDVDNEKLALEIQRKIEQKRLEALQQRQQQAKSFESAFIQAFAKSIDGPTTSTKTKNNVSNQRIRLKNTTTATVTNIKQYTANNDAEDLLQATWIENLENENTHIISDDDEPQEHRIYKQQEELQLQREYYRLPSNLTISKVSTTTNSNSKYSSRATKKTANRNQEEFITGDDDYEENNHYANNSLNVQQQPVYRPKNVDPQMTVTGKSKDRCVICSLNCQRLVHHYVNEHRGCETYNSRLTATQIKKLKQGNCTASVSLYKNGQNLYEAFCIFCNKISRFMLRYWYQHYTMHTGEYAYRCTGCGIRKPTQSLLTLHHSQGCPEVGGGIIQDYAYDAKSLQIEAKICSLCNYLQLHRSNIVKHLHTQHNIKQILPKHILTVVLMKIPPTLAATSSTVTNTPDNATRRSISTRSASAVHSPSDTFVIEDDDNDVNYEEILPEDTSQPPRENRYYNYIPPYMQAALNSGNLSFENLEAGEDLSYMISGMLDVQMNTNDAN